MIEPLWLSVGRAFVGIQEVAGPASNPIILRWARDIGAPSWYANDGQPWCAVWMNRLMKACKKSMAGTGFELLRAKTFESWGQKLRQPSLGAVLVFSRPEGAHVGLYLGETDTNYRVLGANQSNAITEMWIAKPRLTAIRWPADEPLPTTGPVTVKADGQPVSQNEA